MEKYKFEPTLFTSKDLNQQTVEGFYPNLETKISLDLDVAIRLIEEDAGIVVKENLIYLKSNEDIKREVLKRDQYTCQFCGERAQTIKRITTKKEGGLFSPKNAITTCNKCQNEKKVKTNHKFDYELQIRRMKELLTGEEVNVISLQPYFEHVVSYEIAINLVKEEAAYLKPFEKNTLYLIFNDDSLKVHILNRDHFSCYQCGERAVSIERIIEKKDKGLRSPKNMRSVCNKCKRDMSSLILSNAHLNNECEYKKMKNLMSEFKGDEIKLIHFPERKEQIINKKQAMTLLSDRVSFLLDKDPTVLFMNKTNKEISKLAIERDKKRCQRCGKRTLYLEKIVSDSHGGLHTVSNLRSVCPNSNCNGISKHSMFSKNKSVHFAIPIYAKNHELSHVLENPNRKTIFQVFDEEYLNCFCDISEYINEDGPTGVYGAALIVAGTQKDIRVFQHIIHSTPGVSTLAELKNVEWTINTLRLQYSGLKLPVIHTDVDINGLSTSQKNNSPTVELWKNIKPKNNNLKIKNIRPHEQNEQELYQMAHLYSREAVRTYIVEHVLKTS